MRPTARRIYLLAGTTVAVLGLDVISKAIVVHTLSDRPPVRLLGGAVRLIHTRNTGAAFSLAEGQTLVLSVIAIAVVAAIIRTARRLGSTAWAVCLGLILGGALGNLIDRVFRAPGPLRGAVVDWIDLQVWPVFNLADSALVIGVCMAVLLEVRGRRIDGSHVTGGRARG
ncbi:MAG: signal peptidase II [Mycobacteriales bacterium]